MVNCPMRWLALMSRNGQYHRRLRCPGRMSLVKKVFVVLVGLRSVFLGFWPMMARQCSKVTYVLITSCGLSMC